MLCPPCNTVLVLREAPENLRRAFRELWVLPLIMGLGIFLLFILMGLGGIGYASPQVTSALPGLGCFLGVPLLLVALLSGVTRALAVAWIGVVLELLVVVLCLAGYENLFSIVFAILAAIVPIMTVFQIFKIKDLQHLQQAPLAEPVPSSRKH